MDFDLTEEQRLLCESIADFARAENDNVADRTPDSHRGQQKAEQADRGCNSGCKGRPKERRRLA